MEMEWQMGNQGDTRTKSQFGEAFLSRRGASNNQGFYGEEALGLDGFLMFFYSEFWGLVETDYGHFGRISNRQL